MRGESGGSDEAARLRAVRRGLGAEADHVTVTALQTVDSTNAYLKRLARAWGEAHPDGVTRLWDDTPPEDRASFLPPALALADTGIAVGSGTAAAIEVADAVLISEDLRNVPAIFALSRKTLRIIKQNLFWAFAYNALGIPLAAGLFEAFYSFAHVSPAFCAAAMGASSVTVVLNALRLKFR